MGDDSLHCANIGKTREQWRLRSAVSWSLILGSHSGDCHRIMSSESLKRAQESESAAHWTSAADRLLSRDLSAGNERQQTPNLICRVA